MRYLAGQLGGKNGRRYYPSICLSIMQHKMLYGETKTKRERPTFKKEQDLNTKFSGGKFYNFNNFWN
jgi:hypothetical protein